MSNLIKKDEPQSIKIEQVLLKGDLSGLKPEEKISYYNQVCVSMGLNPLTKPFEFLRYGGKEVLYATRNCSDQLCSIHNISTKIINEKTLNDVYIVTCEASLPNGRITQSNGALPINNLKGDQLANQFMKTETKAKRRSVLSLVGLSMMDETEAETIKDAVKVPLNQIESEIEQPQEPKSEPKKEDPALENIPDAKEKKRNEALAIYKFKGGKFNGHEIRKFSETDLKKYVASNLLFENQGNVLPQEVKENIAAIQQFLGL